MLEARFGDDHLKNSQRLKDVWLKEVSRVNFFNFTQPAFACSKLTIETLEQGVKYVQS